MPDTKRFLHGSFAPVTEEVTALDLPVTGHLPAELTGRYLRNGPNPLGLDDPNYHWFMGAPWILRAQLVLAGGLAQVSPACRTAAASVAVPR